VFSGKSIIGIVGGIGSGKSFVASLFGELGCLVIDSDRQVASVYRDPDVQKTLRQWWGDAVIGPDGNINRSLIASKVFNNPLERERLEQLVHPRVHAAREAAMRQAANDPTVVAFVWDTPLLLETGLNRECDAIVYVDAPLEQCLQRVKNSRGWDEAELARREILQSPLDSKREIADYQVSNAADAEEVRRQVRHILSRILETPKERVK
jgi:dephospho-CoA kinase